MSRRIRDELRRARRRRRRRGPAATEETGCADRCGRDCSCSSRSSPGSSSLGSGPGRTGSSRARSPWPGASRRMLADGRLGAAVARSLARLAQGYALSALVGVPLGVLLARSELVRAALRPLVLGLQALPVDLLAAARHPLVRALGDGHPVRRRDGLAARHRDRDRGRASRAWTPCSSAPPARSASAARASTSGVLLPAALPGHPHRPEARLELRLARPHGGRAALRRGRARAAPAERPRAARRGAGHGRHGRDRRDWRHRRPRPVPRPRAARAAAAGASSRPA